MGNPSYQLRTRGPLGHGAGGARIADSRIPSPMVEDTAKAAVEEIMRLSVRSMSNSQLIKEANRKSDQILRGDTAGPRHHNAIVETLFEMLHTLEKRIQQAPRDNVTFLPKLPGVKWDPNDPLAGIVEAIDPFGMSNFWTMRIVSAIPAARRLGRSNRMPQPSGGGSRGGGGTPDFPGSTDAPGIGDGLGLDKPKGLKEGLTDAAADVAADIAAEAIPILNFFLLAKTAYDYLVKWIYAKDAGLKVAERRVALKVIADGIASMAIKIGPPNTTRRPPGVESGSMKIRPPVVPWYGVDIPEPDSRGVEEDLTMIMNGRQVNKPSDVRRAVTEGRKKGLEYAKLYIANRNLKKKGDGYTFLWKLKKKFRNNREKIREHITRELRKELCYQTALTRTQRGTCLTVLR